MESNSTQRVSPFPPTPPTRAPWVDEIHGKSYFFIDKPMFEDLISQSAFVEHATFSGDQYVTSKRTISDQIEKGPVVVLDIEMNGVRQMKANPSIDARYVFI
ncbi:P-loop containing nucleoside triphosphate hydrolase protein [Aspergillus eucalypticola CBS 122712]|uniref:P-loop containing nucleoside triphosphate hydrolase protein n=1 Tax=Aspergillus eucalypticola (strain CBS 122712 / IBT 29274) TaxID=1448314 RepID=A0A317VVB8_ASPEC|nr:P-loop containing nucleoside triphosphate hydrolase protein [Aspergillus eucalypticola CBS 122712]PWY76912.1 P-loop containing nucleoside triphosphate hydrolase protein [Aspergillus eucalypticola CBS 122712]